VPAVTTEPLVQRRTQPDDIEYWETLWRMEPASVTISRTHAEDFGQRQLVVSLDGERLGDLLFGDAISREVAPGSHSLRVSNTLVWKTVAFDVTPGQQVRFEAINRTGKLTYPMLVIFGAGPLYVTLRRLI
jgi:hypothetical protein